MLVGLVQKFGFGAGVDMMECFGIINLFLEIFMDRSKLGKIRNLIAVICNCWNSLKHKRSAIRIPIQIEI